MSAASVEYFAVALKLVRDSPQVDSTLELTTCGMLAKNRDRRHRIVAQRLPWKIALVVCGAQFRN